MHRFEPSARDHPRRGGDSGLAIINQTGAHDPSDTPANPAQKFRLGCARALELLLFEQVRVRVAPVRFFEPFSITVWSQILQAVPGPREQNRGKPLALLRSKGDVANTNSFSFFRTDECSSMFCNAFCAT